MTESAPTPVPGRVEIEPLTLDEVRRLQDGRGLARPVDVDFPSADTLDAVGMVLAAREALGLGESAATTPWGVYLILLDGEVVGDIGFHGPPTDGPTPTVEIGYNVVPSRRGRGVATTACRLLLERAWSAGARRVRAETEPANVASQRVLQASGFRRAPDGSFVLDAPAATR